MKLISSLVCINAKRKTRTFMGKRLLIIELNQGENENEM
jgi:hypothetical protein